MDQSKVESIFETLGKEFTLSPVKHNYKILVDLKTLSLLTEIKALLIDLNGKIESP
ncbi:MAG: hypothetical protein HN416_12985 [Nitrospina sp.]|jgi:hypothetical protein|nr:hypothetical protein [Nitrospina sp.]